MFTLKAEEIRDAELITICAHSSFVAQIFFVYAVRGFLVVSNVD